MPNEFSFDGCDFAYSDRSFFVFQYGFVLFVFPYRRSQNHVGINNAFEVQNDLFVSLNIKILPPQVDRVLTRTHICEENSRQSSNHNKLFWTQTSLRIVVEPNYREHKGVVSILKTIFLFLIETKVNVLQNVWINKKKQTLSIVFEFFIRNGQVLFYAFSVYILGYNSGMCWNPMNRKK